MLGIQLVMSPDIWRPGSGKKPWTRESQSTAVWLKSQGIEVTSRSIRMGKEYQGETLDTPREGC
jgi:hypothetical protein